MCCLGARRLEITGSQALAPPELNSAVCRYPIRFVRLIKLQSGVEILFFQLTLEQSSGLLLHSYSLLKLLRLGVSGSQGVKKNGVRSPGGGHSFFRQMHRVG